MSPDRIRTTVDGIELTVGNLERVLYPTDGYTKGDVLHYYATVAPYLLPHLAGRPVTLVRNPDGVREHLFYEKHVPKGAPEWLGRIAVPRTERSAKEGIIEYPAIDNTAGLTWAANLGTLEFHVPLWRSETPGAFGPFDQMVFDLDPGPPATIVECAHVAAALFTELTARGYDTFRPKTSGSKGLQVYVPLDPPRAPEDVHTEAHEIAKALERAHPRLIVSNMRKDLRKGKVLVDWSQNSRIKTTVAAYPLRAREHPTVSTPVTWEEVAACADAGDPESLRFTADDVLKRTARLGDLFAL